MRVVLLHTRIRVEEQLLLDAFEKRSVAVTPMHADELLLDLTAGSPLLPVGTVVLDRCMSHSKALAILHTLEAQGAVCLNRPSVVDTCGDKLRTTVALTAAGVPSPRSIAVFTAEQAAVAAESLGYPLVLKPTVGSWGRMIARINDRDALEAVIEHKTTLGGVQHGVVYLQEFINKPGRDIRAFVVGGRTIAAIGRASQHWITNTARGATTHAVEVTPGLNDLCVRAAEAVGGGMLAIDLLEDPQRGLLINEVNSTMEFRNSIAPTGVDIPGLIAEHVMELAGMGVVVSGAAVGGAA